jgi:biotin carboxyl carrier protein
MFCAAATVAISHAALAQEPPAVVTTMTARSSTWQADMQAVGSLRAVRGTDLAAEIPGIVDWIGFESGRDVEAGTVLVKLRPNDDAAKLTELQAAADLAAANLARDQKQFRAQAVSQATIDADDSHLRAARAQIAEQQALMAEKVVRAPFSGRLGLRQVDVGQYLPSGTPMVTLQALDPICRFLRASTGHRGSARRATRFCDTGWFPQPSVCGNHHRYQLAVGYGQPHGASARGDCKPKSRASAWHVCVGLPANWGAPALHHTAAIGARVQPLWEHGVCRESRPAVDRAFGACEGGTDPW